MDRDINSDQLFSFMRIEPEKLSNHLELFIKEHMDKLERDGIILGLSGGIDSAVVASLCQRAVGAEKTLALIMPDKDSKKAQVDDALSFARELGIKAKLIDITPYLKNLGIYNLFVLNKIPLPQNLRQKLNIRASSYYQSRTGETPFMSGLLGSREKEFSEYLRKTNAYYRIKHRLRMTILYLHAEQENRLVVGAANKTEYSIGFFVKHGIDDAADIMPILNLYKTQVRELARFLNIPPKIIDKAPSPDVIPGIIDEEAIGVPYEKMDLILLALNEGLKPPEIVKLLQVTEKDILYIQNLTQMSAHMRKTYTA